jgi:predicted transposase YbfD/YdcC
VGWLIERHPAWKSIRSIGVVESSREEQGQVSVERRYYVLSLPADSEAFARVVRGHWGIENSLQYVLDVAFGEDDRRLRKDKGPGKHGDYEETGLEGGPWGYGDEA